MSDWIEGTKPKKIEARFSAYLSWDLDDEGIDWDDIEVYDVWGANLHITFKDGTEKVIENWNDIQIDYKHNLEEVLILDNDWREVEGLS